MNPKQGGRKSETKKTEKLCTWRIISSRENFSLFSYFTWATTLYVPLILDGDNFFQNARSGI